MKLVVFAIGVVIIFLYIARIIDVIVLKQLLTLLVISVLVWPHLTNIIENYALPTDPILLELREKLTKLHPRFKDIKIYSGDRSYTINKSRVYICLKDENGMYYSKMMLMYVGVHECAHILCPEIDTSTDTHSKEFFVIFNQLLERASDMGLYDRNFVPLKNYCGVKG